MAWQNLVWAGGAAGQQFNFVFVESFVTQSFHGFCGKLCVIMSYISIFINGVITCFYLIVSKDYAAGFGGFSVYYPKLFLHCLIFYGLIGQKLRNPCYVYVLH